MDESLGRAGRLRVPKGLPLGQGRTCGMLSLSKHPGQGRSPAQGNDSHGGVLGGLGVLFHHQQTGQHGREGLHDLRIELAGGVGLDLRQGLLR
jgi:hypothetical protein